MSTVHQPPQGVQPDPSRWADFDAAWEPPQAHHVNTHDSFLAAFVAAGNPDPYGDRPYTDEPDWADHWPDCLSQPVSHFPGLDRSSWPTDAGEPESPGYVAPYRPTVADDLAVALGLTTDLPGLIDSWADHLRRDQAPAWLVGRVRALGDTARFLGATTFDEFDDREAIMEGDREEACYAGSHDDGQPLW